MSDACTRTPPFHLPLRHCNYSNICWKKKILPSGGGALPVPCAVSRTHLSPASRLRCAPHPAARVALARLRSLIRPVCLQGSNDRSTDLSAPVTSPVTRWEKLWSKLTNGLISPVSTGVLLCFLILINLFFPCPQQRWLGRSRLRPLFLEKRSPARPAHHSNGFQQLV